jgi:hypothetical protein
MTIVLPANECSGPLATGLHAVTEHPPEGFVKRTALVLILALIATPTLVRAHEDHDRDDRHSNVSAKEMAGIGLAGAALLGVAGYAILRKRNISV